LFFCRTHFPKEQVHTLQAYHHPILINEHSKTHFPKGECFFFLNLN
jgi:hypothetical protein